jgi:hypothetical protein
MYSEKSRPFKRQNIYQEELFDTFSEIRYVVLGFIFEQASHANVRGEKAKYMAQSHHRSNIKP